jgi:ribosome-associated protein YbcJ (S4-like RNA binding protein)
MKRELIKQIKEYIEETEVKVDGEWGDCRDLKELIRDGEMPDIYFEVCNLL